MTQLTDQKDQAIENAILHTLSNKKLFSIPLSTTELTELLMPEVAMSAVSNDKIIDVLESLVSEDKVFIYEDCVSDQPDGLKEAVEKKKNGIRNMKEIYKKAQNVFAAYERIPSVEAVCIDTRPIYDSSSKVSISIVLNKENIEIPKSFLSLYMKFRKAKKDYSINYLQISELKIKDQTPEKAYELLCTKPIVNKNKMYEKYIHTNLWVFEYFSNFPVKKISLGYRVLS